MSMSTAWNNMGLMLERHRARFESEPVGEQDRTAPRVPATRAPEEETSSLTIAQGDDEADQAPELEEASDDGDSISARNNDNNHDVEHQPAATTDAATNALFAHVHFNQNDHLTTLAELEEERELARRRSSACVMFAVFVLFRLWIEALSEGDFGLLLLALVCTSWTARWVRHQRDREEELDRRIALFLQQQQTPGGANGGVDRNDLRLLSFQAQLALAIMESQRQMMQGGYGNDSSTNRTPGVTEQAKARWVHFPFEGALGCGASTSKAGYGSVSQQEECKENAPVTKRVEDEPHCSICLCEYEDGETLVKLPCKHVYHDECISSWTTNHVKCPLCNFDLETAPVDSASDNGSTIV
jgi:hypothetical protein